jgi:DNA-binding CsgD family transcriptional regulator/tetratricopeptide (TPR) repeat protein
VTSPVFVGRAVELAELTAAYDAAAEAASVVLVGGEAGIGKSRLIAEFTARLDSKDARVVEGGCLELGSDGLPYAPFVAVTRRLVRDLGPEQIVSALPGGGRSLARWLPELASSQTADAEDGGKPRLFEEILTLLEHLAAERPLVVVLEDLHWADASSRELLVFLIHNLTCPGVLLVGTYRSTLEAAHPLRPLLAELGRAPRVRLLAPVRFGRAEVERQLTAILGTRPVPELVARILDRSEGNPLFVEALVQAGETTPETVRELLLSGLWTIPDQSRRLLRVASVAGGQFGHALLPAVTGLDDYAVEDALRPIVDRQLLVPAGDGYVFRHALIRSAVYEDLLPGERTRLHAGFAEALVASPSLVPEGRAPAEVANHWYAAGAHRRALTAAWDAAASAQRSLAYEEQHRMLERVLELWPLVTDAESRIGVDRAAVLVLAAGACLFGGNGERGRELATAALDEIDATAEPMRAVEALEFRSRLEHRISGGGGEDVEAALRLLPDDPDLPARGRLLGQQAHLILMAGDYERSRLLGKEIWRIAEQADDARLRYRARIVQSVVVSEAGDHESALELVGEAAELAKRWRNPDDLLTAMLYESAALISFACDYERAAAVLRPAIVQARRVGMASMRGTMLASNLAMCLFKLGEWEELDEVLAEALASAPPPLYRSGLLFSHIDLSTARGALAVAAESVAESVSIVEDHPDAEWIQQGQYASQLRMMVAQDGPVAAAHQLWRALADQRLLGRPVFAWPVLEVGGRIQVALLDQAGRDQGTRDEAARLRAALDAVSRDLPAATRRDQAWRLTYLAGTTNGGGSPPAWNAAVDQWRDLKMPYHAARALAGGARADLEAGDRSSAVAKLREAATIAAGLGAVPLAQEVEQLAARARLVLTPDAGRISGPVSGDAAERRHGLTPRELEVLRLIADGRSNRQIAADLFISANTAGVHVSRILAKLGVTTRTEAAARAHRLQLFDS